MKILLTFTIALASILGIGHAALARPDDKPACPAQEALRPGPEHALLQKLVGRWDAVLIAQDATGKEQRTRGTKTTTKHTDFHSLDDFEGEFMGLKMLGHGVNGYCAIRHQYFTFWTDSMTPSPMVLYGDYDAASRELRMSGECFGMSSKLEKCRTVTRFQDDDHVAWALYGVGPDGREMQFLRIEYTRKR